MLAHPPSISLPYPAFPFLSPFANVVLIELLPGTAILFSKDSYQIYLISITSPTWGTFCETTMQAETLKRSSQKTETMQLLGMQGPDCADAIDRALSTVPGVAQVSVSLADQKATITYDMAQANVKHLQSAIKQAGFESLKPVHGEDGNCCGGCGG